jgi:hypothetical protein
MANSADLFGPLIQQFVTQLVRVVAASTQERITSALASAMGRPLKRGPGRPPKNPLALAVLPNGRRTRMRAKQLCPVPGCKNVAAPIFGMVCAEHKDVSKAKIRKYREARRRAKERRAA